MGLPTSPILYILYGNLKSEISQDYAQETSTKLYIQEFGFRLSKVRLDGLDHVLSF
jgi:hypothetical protein